jgi:hypothetical protein
LLNSSSTAIDKETVNYRCWDRKVPVFPGASWR